MPSATELTQQKRFRALYIGHKHSGKTVAACSHIPADPNKKIYLFDGDGRIGGILGAKWIDRSRIDYDYYPPIGDGSGNLMQRINDKCNILFQEFKNKSCVYDTIIADSLTSFAKGLIETSMPYTHATGAKHASQKIAATNIPGMDDYMYESVNTNHLIAALRSMPAQNVIVTGHIIDKYAKADTKNPYSDMIVVGEKIHLRDKIWAEVGIYFDNIFRFQRRLVGGEERFFVTFIDDIACTSLPDLRPGEFDITGKNFQEFLRSQIQSVSQKEEK